MAAGMVVHVSIMISTLLTFLTPAFALMLLIQPIDSLGDDEEDERGSSHCEMVKACLEHILMRLGFNRLGAADRAAIA